EPLVVKDYREERRFKISPLLLEHGILSGVTVPIAPRQRTFGVLGVYSSKPRVFTNEEVHFLISAATALALAVERNRAESELQRLAVFAQLNPNPALEFASDGAITYFNDAALKLALSVQKAHPRDVLPPKYQEILDVCLRTGYSKSQMQTRVEGRTFSWSFHPVAANRVVHCYVEDITDRLNLEGQLLQSQKMESVGQLAAGVAHDFNNMLTIIQGHAGMLMARPNLPPEMFDSAQTVYYASERAASLTRQLLMFSRKNVMQTKPLDMREVVSNLSKMLRRILGETVTLDFKPPESLPVVVGDDGMMEQVIMNLSVNARDAMPRGGLLTISLDHMVVEENDVQTNPEARAGEFVVLRVTDTGTGMDRTTMCRIFEPFFTTKEVGKGTGLGLATVYGIVKQHDGWVEVASEVGQGTTFTVFLPASHETAKAGKTGDDPIAPVTGGTETILVVEDEVIIREMAQTLLEELGYKILLAENGREALEVWEQNHDSIDLLLTDMVMPEGVSGMELAEQLLAQKPGLKVVFASGYTVDEVSEEFLARNNARFLQKPYNRASLSRAVRQAFDEVTATRAAD
ncbi:MAG: response regulator, partial [Verrucomicrobia bacterium]|nr:response regulator [Verrucomicrobiota bacterium]